MGALPGGPYNSAFLMGPIWRTQKKLRAKGELSSWASDVSCSEVPEGATGQDPVKSRTGGTPLIEEEHLSGSRTSGNLEGLTESRLSQFPIFKEESLWCRQKAGEESQADGGSHWGHRRRQPQSASGDQPPSLQEPNTSAASGTKIPRGRGASLEHTKATAVCRRHSGWRAG
jgi:hypothetical protein